MVNIKGNKYYSVMHLHVCCPKNSFDSGKAAGLKPPEAVLPEAGNVGGLAC